MSVVIALIPEADDPVWKVSSEPKAHMTLLYLDDSILDYEEDLLAFVQHVAETSLYEFGLTVDHRGTLGADDADVLFFEKNWMIQNLKECRGHLLTNPQINIAYSKADQFPQWTPHLTLGYPDKPAKDLDYPINFVQFDRIAVWTTEDDGPEFRLRKKAFLMEDYAYHDDLVHGFGDLVKKFTESDVVRDARGQFSKISSVGSGLEELFLDLFGDGSKVSGRERDQMVEEMMKNLKDGNGKMATNPRRGNKDVFNPNAKLDTSQISEPSRNDVERFIDRMLRTDDQLGDKMDNVLTGGGTGLDPSKVSPKKRLKVKHDDLEHGFGDFVKKFSESDVVRDARGQFSKKSGQLDDSMKEFMDEYGDEIEYRLQKFLLLGDHHGTDRGKAQLDAHEATIDAVWTTQNLADNMNTNNFMRPPTRKETSAEIDKKLDEIRDDSWAHAKKQTKEDYGKVKKKIKDLNPFSHSVFEDPSYLAHDMIDYFGLPALVHKVDSSISSDAARETSIRIAAETVLKNLDEIMTIFGHLLKDPKLASTDPNKLFGQTVGMYLRDSLAHSIEFDTDFFIGVLDEHGIAHAGVKGMRWGVRKADAGLVKVGQKLVERDQKKFDKVLAKRNAKAEKAGLKNVDEGRNSSFERIHHKAMEHFAKDKKPTDPDTPVTSEDTAFKYGETVAGSKWADYASPALGTEGAYRKFDTGEKIYDNADEEVALSASGDILKSPNDLVAYAVKHSDVELYHHGVKGMRWGYRRAVDSNGYVKGLAKKVGRAKGESKAESKGESSPAKGKKKPQAPVKSSDQIRMENTLKKSLEQMSTREIKELNGRIEAANKLQKTQKALKDAEKSNVKKLADFLIDNAKKGATDAAAAQVRAMSGGVVNKAFKDLADGQAKSGKDEKAKENKVTDSPKKSKSKSKTSKTPATDKERDLLIADLVNNVYNVSPMPKKRG